MNNWSFKDSKNWDKKFNKCNSDNQSPINIDSENIEPCHLLCLLDLNYDKSRINCKNTKNMIIFNVDNKNTITFNDDIYDLKKIIFHLPSLHHVNNNPYQMEVNFYHKSRRNEQLIISFFVTTDGNNEQSIREFAKLIKNVPTKINETYSSGEEINLNRLLPLKKSFYTYKGSLPYPPCDNDVTWIIFENTSSINISDYNFIKNQHFNNVRKPLPKLGNRTVYYSDNLLKLNDNFYDNSNDNKNNNVNINNKKLKCRKITKKTRFVKTIHENKCKQKNIKKEKSVNPFITEKTINTGLQILIVLAYILVFLFIVYLSRIVLKSLFSHYQNGSNYGEGYFYPNNWIHAREFNINPNEAGILSGYYKLTNFFIAILFGWKNFFMIN